MNQQIGGQGAPQILAMQTTDGNRIEVCGNCHTPVPPAHSFQGPDNKVWRKRSCPSCGAIFTMEGPFRDHQTANPRVFK